MIVKQRRQNKKSEKEFSHERVARVVGTIMILAVAVGYCLIMANRYQSYSLDCVSTDTKKILNEMPFLEFTEEEMAVFSEIFENPSVAAYKGNGEQTIPAEEIRVLVNDVIPAGAVNVSAAIYDVQGENDSKESSLLQIKYVADELEFCVDCYDMGSIEKIVAKNSGKIIYANENNEHFEKYVHLTLSVI